MKKIKYVIVSLLLFCLLPFVIEAKNDVDLYIFWGDGCPHCAHEKAFLKGLQKKDKDLNIHMYEVWNDEDNADLLYDVKRVYKEETSMSVPFTVIGKYTFTGYSDSIAMEIEEAINICHNKKCPDYVEKIKSGDTVKIGENEEKDVEKKEMNIPLIGKVDVKSFSLPIIAIVIGFVDGFNPCAMWILLFLISMLLGMKNKKRMWALGITFLVASAVVYLLFMVAWLQITLQISQIILVRMLIALVAVIAGILNLKSFMKASDSGCEVVDDKKRKKIIDKIKKFTHEKSFVLALIGVITLAFSVNLVELACSAGLPLMFTQILALNDLSTLEYAIYILIYIFFFLLDDLIVFIVAMLTLQVTGITTKYNKYSHLIGGIIMILIAILLVFKPEWIMFNF